MVSGVSASQIQTFSTKGMKLADIKEKNELLFNYLIQQGYTEEQIIYETDIQKILDEFEAGGVDEMTRKDVNGLLGVSITRKARKAVKQTMLDIQNNDLSNSQELLPVKVDDNTTEYHDGKGVLIYSQTQTKDSTTKTYYLGGRKDKVDRVEERSAKGGVTTTTYLDGNAKRPQEKVIKDSSGNVVSKTEYSYSADGLVSEQVKKGNDVKVTRYAYVSGKRVVSETTERFSSDNESSISTKNKYDEQGNLTGKTVQYSGAKIGNKGVVKEEYEYSGSQPKQKVVTYNDGRVETYRNANGQLQLVEEPKKAEVPPVVNKPSSVVLTQPQTTVKKPAYKSKTLPQNYIPKSAKERVEEINKSGGTSFVRNNGDGTYSVVQTKGAYLTKNKIDLVEIKYDEKGKQLEQYQVYQDGHVIKMEWKNGKRTVSTIVQGNTGKFVFPYSAPDNVKNMSLKLTSQRNQNKIYKRENGNFSIVVTNGLSLKKSNLKFIEYEFDSNGKRIGEYYTYQNGTVEHTTYDAKGNKKTKIITSAASSAKKPVAKTAVPKATTPKTETPKTESPEMSTLTAKPSSDSYGQYVYPGEFQYPEKMMNVVVNLRQKNAECTIQVTKTGFEIKVDKYGFKLPEFAAQDNVLYFDKEGNLLKQEESNAFQKVETTYVEGKAQQPKVTTKIGSTFYASEFEPHKYESLDAQRKVAGDNVPVEISINIPEKYSDQSEGVAEQENLSLSLSSYIGGGNFITHIADMGLKKINDTNNSTVRQNFKNYTDSLRKNKASLMRDLHITNEQYDNLVSIAMGIAEQESHFGDYIWEDTKGNTHTQARLIEKQVAGATGYLEGSNHSWGVTQMNWHMNFEGDNEPNKTLRAQAKKYGITSYEDYKDDPAKAAIVTMIVLNNKRITAESEIWQKRLADNNAKITNPEEYITTDDIIALSYNGMGAIAARFKDEDDVVKITDNNTGKKDAKGNIIKDGLSYARIIRAYRSEFFPISTNQAKRDSLNAAPQENNGQIGSVIFMPKAYTASARNTQAEIKLLKDVLDKNTTINQEVKDELLEAVKQNEIAFGHGLTAAEANSITQNDAILILNHLKQLRANIENAENPSQIRTEAQNAQQAFKQEYIASRRVIVRTSDVSPSQVLTAFRHPEEVDEQINPNRMTIVKQHQRAFTGGRKGRAAAARAYYARSQAAGRYTGFGIETDKGVNPYYSNGYMIPKDYRILAETASAVSRDMDLGGRCATGVKAALESSQVIYIKDPKTGQMRPMTRQDVVYPKGHPKYGQPIDVAKDLVLFYRAHPEAFEEVKYVDIGNNRSRELESTDVFDLPAAYLGVWTPGPGFEDKEGHAFITNGNGQGYADEVDNLRWDDFSNGKGEHGTLNVFRLKVRNA